MYALYGNINSSLPRVLASCNFWFPKLPYVRFPHPNRTHDLCIIPAQARGSLDFTPAQRGFMSEFFR